MEPLKADTGFVEHPEPHLAGAPSVRPADPQSGLFNTDSTMIRGLYGKALLHSDFDDSLRAHTAIVPYRDQGIAGDPVPYRFRTDNYVTIALLLDFFLGVLVIARSLAALSGQQHQAILSPLRPSKYVHGAQRHGTPRPTLPHLTDLLYTRRIDVRLRAESPAGSV